MYLIAATGLVILLKLDPKSWFVSARDLEIWWMTSKNNRAPLLCYIKLWASFRIHELIQSGVAIRKHSIRVKIGVFLPHVTLQFNRRIWKTIGCLFYTMSSFVHHFKAMGEFNADCNPSPQTLNSGQNQLFFCPVWHWNLMDDLEKQ